MWGMSPTKGKCLVELFGYWKDTSKSETLTTLDIVLTFLVQFLFHTGKEIVAIVGPTIGMERNRRSALVDHFGRVRRSDAVSRGIRITRSQDSINELPDIKIYRRSGLVDHFGRF